MPVCEKEFCEYALNCPSSTEFELWELNVTCEIRVLNDAIQIQFESWWIQIQVQMFQCFISVSSYL